MRYAIAWTSLFDNKIDVEFYDAESEFEAAKECWKAHMLVGVTDNDLLNILLKECDNFSSINDIGQYFFNCDENISNPVLVAN